MEPLARRGTSFINTAEKAISLIRQIDHLNFKLHLDVNAMSDEERPYPQIIKNSKKYLFHFYANNSNGLGPGFGKVDFGPIIKALKEIGYSGFFSVEVFDLSPRPKRMAKKSFVYLKNFL